MRPWPIVFLILSLFTTFTSFTTLGQVAEQSSAFMPASNTLALKHYTTKDGLSGNAIRCLFEDHQGILWIGTNKGVSLFDGQKISPLVSDLNSPLSSAVIFKITQDKDDSIWIATHYRGVFHYSPHSKTYTRYGEEGKDLGLISQTVRAMLIDDAGTLWVGTDKGLHRYNKSNDRFEHINSPADNDNALSNQINAIASPDANHLWLGTANGLVYFDQKTAKFTRFNHQPDLANSLVNNKVQDLMIDNAKKLWIATAHGLSTTLAAPNGNNVVFNTINAKHDRNMVLCTTNTNKLMLDSQQRLWLGTASNGACMGDNNASHFNRFSGNSDDKETLRSNDVSDILQDREGNIWLGTKAGLSVLKNDTSAVEVLALKSPLGQSTQVQTVFNSSDNLLILITQRHTFKVDKKTLKTVQTTSLPQGSSIVYSLHLPGHGAFALKNRDPVLYRLDQGSLKYQATPFSLPKSLYPYNNVSLHQVKAEQLAVATEKNAHVVNIVDYSVTKLFGGLTTHAEEGVLAIHQHNQRLWTCPAHHEFTSYDLANNQWQSVFSKLTPSETLKCNRLIHSQQGVWGISLRTVFRLGPDSNEIITELNEPGVATVLEVGDNLWLVRAEELVKYHLPTGHKTRIRLSQLENLGHSARNNSFFDAQTQQLYIPVSQRLLRVNLNQIKPQGKELTVNLREFSLFNHPVDVWRDESIKADASIAYAKSVQLDYSQYMFQLSFAADSLGNAQDILYRYRLKGFDSNWIDTTADKAFALYSGVSDGHYRFDVQATRDPDNWPATSKSTDIIITPPWWKTWWAYLSYAVVLIKLALSILWLVYRRELAEKDRQSVVAVAKAKEQFFANISHEFRTPLTLILGPITRLREKAQEPTERKALAVVERNAHRLATMVDQILDLAKLQGFKQTTLRVQNVTEVVDFVVQSFQDLVTAQQITLVIDNQTNTPPWVEVMPDALEKILTNLLSNAFKYGGSGTTVTVIVATNNNQLKLCVNDTGKGMDADDLAVVFERFTRIDETSHTAPGTGIGLALVKELVEHHNGTITVESAVGKGSRFSVTMPLSQTQKKPEGDVLINTHVVQSSVAALASSDSALDSGNETTAVEGELVGEQSGDKPHILVIEDNPDMREYITNLLEQQYQCSSAQNGKLGLEKAIATVPDLIISDVMMPVMDGFEVAKNLREQECTSHIPLILLTAKDDVDSRMQGWQQNIDDYIAKPFHQRELLIRVENLLAIRTILRKRFATLLNDSVAQGASINTGVGIAKTLNANDVKTDDLGDKNIEFIQRFEKLVADNYHDKDFNRKEAASEMALSERQLHRKLAGLVDYNFSDFLRQFRLQQACNLLGRGFQVARISDEVGFSSPSYFSSCFKAEFGMTVKQYEKKQALEE